MYLIKRFDETNDVDVGAVWAAHRVRYNFGGRLIIAPTQKAYWPREYSGLLLLCAGHVFFYLFYRPVIVTGRGGHTVAAKTCGACP